MVTKKLLPLAALLPLAGCISFGAKPPRTLLTLNATAAPQPGTTQSSAGGHTITILVPVTAQLLATQRVPVMTGDQIAYVQQVAWVEPPARLFARLLSDTVSTRTGRVVLSTAQSFGDPGARLSGELRNFGVDASAHQAVVTFDASLIRTDGGAVEKRRFEARAPVSAITGPTVGAPIEQAANQVASEVSDWVGR